MWRPYEPCLERAAEPNEPSAFRLVKIDQHPMRPVHVQLEPVTNVLSERLTVIAVISIDRGTATHASRSMLANIVTDAVMDAAERMAKPVRREPRRATGEIGQHECVCHADITRPCRCRRCEACGAAVFGMHVCPVQR